MPARRDDQSKGETKLARLRTERKVTQRELARVTGISYPTYWRLERGRMENPPLRYLVNCSIALGVDLVEVIEDEWLDWLALDLSEAAEPPPPDWTAGR